MLEAAVRDLKSAAGIEKIADLGAIHSSTFGLQNCDVSLRIERWQGMFHICVETVLSDGPAFRRTRIVKWPYSERDRRDLAKVLVDLHVVRAGPRRGVFVDDRTAAGKWLDTLTRRVVHGTYSFRSPLETDLKIGVTAEIVDIGGARTVTLVESVPRKGHVVAHVPHAAFSRLCAALERYVAIV